MSFNPLNRGGDIHTHFGFCAVSSRLHCFNPLNRGGDIHTRVVSQHHGKVSRLVSILLIEAGIFIRQERFGSTFHQQVSILLIPSACSQGRRRGGDIHTNLAACKEHFAWIGWKCRGHINHVIARRCSCIMAATLAPYASAVSNLLTVLGIASGWVSIRRKEPERGYSTTSPRNDIITKYPARIDCFSMLFSC